MFWLVREEIAILRIENGLMAHESISERTRTRMACGLIKQFAKLKKQDYILHLRHEGILNMIIG